MGFFSFLVLLGIAYLLWRVTDQLPDLIFRLSEIQRDVAEVRRSLTEGATQASAPAAATPASAPAASANTAQTAEDSADTGSVS